MKERKFDFGDVVVTVCQVAVLLIVLAIVVGIAIAVVAGFAGNAQVGEFAIAIARGALTLLEGVVVVGFILVVAIIGLIFIADGIGDMVDSIKVIKENKKNKQR